VWGGLPLAAAGLPSGSTVRGNDLGFCDGWQVLANSAPSVIPPGRRCDVAASPPKNHLNTPASTRPKTLGTSGFCARGYIGSSDRNRWALFIFSSTAVTAVYLSRAATGIAQRVLFRELPVAGRREEFLVSVGKGPPGESCRASAARASAGELDFTFLVFHFPANPGHADAV
jgi:hypothetical protein